ncbi:hypothetical protein ACFOGJ_04020 [Marinibaculum pumilum]|uniref:Uncharacterized protein n=1 Tax=Marinibaculum pumilum TaxID=1766165 RepID=A0ABV7KW37_9PROT
MQDPRKTGWPGTSSRCRLALFVVSLAALGVPASAAAAMPERPQYYTVSSLPFTGYEPGGHLTGRLEVTCVADPAATITYQAPMDRNRNTARHFLLCSGPIRVTGQVWPTEKPGQSTACTPVVSHQPKEGSWPVMNFVQWRSVEVAGDRIRCEMIAY